MGETPLLENTGVTFADAFRIVARCREEGADAHAAGTHYSACPYASELERAAWLDGWTHAMAVGGSHV